MFSNNPRVDKAFIKFSKEFFDPDICKKYNRYIQLKNGYFKSIEQLVNESIQTWSIPGAGQDPIEQITSAANPTGGVDQDITYYNAAEPLEKLINSTDITVTFRHLDGFINYFFMYETFFKNYMKYDGNYRFMIILTTLSQDNTVCFNGKFSKCLFKSVPDITFAYDNTKRESRNFECTFSFSDFSLEFDLPQGNAKQYNPK